MSKVSNSKPSKSPDRHSFQREGYVKRQAEKGESVSEEYLDYFQKIIEDHNSKFDDPQSRINNMEYDLLTTDWILEKVRSDDAYAQNLYAALCNNEFVRREFWPLLRMNPNKDFWSCSWRYAGGIIADMQKKGDYIDWYCSGIRDVEVYSHYRENEQFTEEQLAHLAITQRYVDEGCITDEIHSDLQQLGWMAVPGGDWDQ